MNMKNCRFISGKPRFLGAVFYSQEAQIKI